MKTIVAAILACLILTGCTDHHEGRVTSKIYTPSSSGLGVTSGGKSVVTFTDETFTLELDDGRDFAQVGKRQYAMSNIGDYVLVDENVFSIDYINKGKNDK